jgi:hypothetical protein
MGTYVYKVTRHTVQLENGELANVAVFAYKDHFWDTKLVARMRKNTACHIAERFVEGKNFTGRVVLGSIENGKVDRTSLSTVAKTVNCGTFDDTWFSTLPTYSRVKGS